MKTLNDVMLMVLPASLFHPANPSLPQRLPVLSLLCQVGRWTWAQEATCSTTLSKPIVPFCPNLCSWQLLNLRLPQCLASQHQRRPWQAAVMPATCPLNPGQQPGPTCSPHITWQPWEPLTLVSRRRWSTRTEPVTADPAAFCQAHRPLIPVR